LKIEVENSSVAEKSVCTEHRPVGWEKTGEGQPSCIKDIYGDLTGLPTFIFLSFFVNATASS